MAYMVQIWDREKWRDTWFTDRTAPQSGIKTRRKPKPSRLKREGLQALRSARRQHPSCKYRLQKVA